MQIHMVVDSCLVVLVLAFWFFRHLDRTRRTPPFPPGPHGWPLIGNFLDFPIYAPYKTFVTMGRKYGPVMSLKLMGERYVVLNSYQAVHDVLVKKNMTTSNRPHTAMGTDLVGWGNATAFSQYDNKFRKHRWFFRQQIGTRGSLKVFYPIVEAAAKTFVHDVLMNQSDLITHCRKTAGSVILKISHGYTVERDDDPLVEMAEKAMQNLSFVMTPGRFLVDAIPILKYFPEWFPGCRFHKDGKRWRRMLEETADTPHSFVLKQLEKGNASPSFTSRLLQEGVNPEEEKTLKWASLSMYLGGSDTTQSALSAFFSAMTIFPEVFNKAQAELDAVIGSERLPAAEDWEDLPYVSAICLELLRWHVIVPMALHATTQDEVYNGYFIPKGAYILGNVWSILSDPETYPNPDVFDPERFLGENQQLDPRKTCFGWGKRACPGARLAELTIFISVATALATLDISRSVKDGVEILPKYEVEEGVLRHIKPFECKILARSKKAEGLLQA